jgi:predicted Holliday junction resolvase-like endonuclease
VQEYPAPLFLEFISQFNPKDACFIGTPLDFIVFEGSTRATSSASCSLRSRPERAELASRERLCRDAIQADRVEYQLL